MGKITLSKGIFTVNFRVGKYYKKETIKNHKKGLKRCTEGVENKWQVQEQ